MEFILPVMETAEAADSIAMARLGRMEDGKYWAAKPATAAEKAGAEVNVEPFSGAFWRGKRSGAA